MSPVLRIEENSMKAYDLLCLVFEPRRYSERGVWVDPYTVSNQYRQTASLYTLVISVTSMTASLRLFCYTAKPSGRTPDNNFTAHADHTRRASYRSANHGAVHPRNSRPVQYSNIGLESGVFA
jgi:hypothetical protein